MASQTFGEWFSNPLPKPGWVLSPNLFSIVFIYFDFLLGLSVCCEMWRLCLRELEPHVASNAKFLDKHGHIASLLPSKNVIVEAMARSNGKRTGWG